MVEFVNTPLVSGLLAGILSGLVVALIVSRVRLFKPPGAGSNEASSGERITVRVRIQVREPRKTSRDPDGDGGGGGDGTEIWVGLGLLLLTISGFATYVDPLTAALLLVSTLLCAALVTAVCLLLIFQIRLAVASWVVLCCGAIGGGVGVFSAAGVAQESMGNVDLKTVDDWLALMYLMVGLLVALVLVAVSVWTLLVLLANAGQELNAPGQWLWAALARTAPPLWWVCIATLSFGALAVALSSGWAFETVTSQDFVNLVLLHELVTG